MRTYLFAEARERNSATSHIALHRLGPPSTTGAAKMMRSILTRTLASAFALSMVAAPFATITANANDDTSMKSDQPVTDTWITTKVKSELATTQGVKSTDITVKTVDGVVTLVGVLSSPMAVNKAVTAAESVKGVKRVDHDGLKSR
jgi:hyperosmotically inducible protein